MQRQRLRRFTNILEGMGQLLKSKKVKLELCVFLTGHLTIKTPERNVGFSITGDGEHVLRMYPNFKIAGPVEIQLDSGILSMEIKPNEKH